MSEEQPVRKTRKKLRIILGGVLAIALLVGIVLITGIPQKRLMINIIEKATGGKVQLGRMSTLGTVKVDSFALDVPPKQVIRKTGLLSLLLPPTPPSTEVEMRSVKIDAAGFALDYSPWWGKNHRFIPSISLDKMAVAVETERKPVESPTPTASVTPPKALEGKGLFSFPKKLKEKFTPDPNCFVPQKVAIGNIEYEAAWPGMGIGLKNIAVNMAAENSKAITAEIKSDAMGGSFWTGSHSNVTTLPESVIDIGFTQKPDINQIDPLRIAIPGMADVTGKLRVAKENGAVMVEVDLPTAKFNGWNLSLAPTADLAVPFKFDTLDFGGTRIQGPVKAEMGSGILSLPEMVLQCKAEGLALGEKGNEFYEGDLAISGHSTPGDKADLVIDAVLNKGQKLTTTLAGNIKSLTLQTAFENWSRDELYNATPKNKRSVWSYMPILEHASGSLGITCELPKLEIAGSFSPSLKFATGVEPAEFSVSCKGGVLSAWHQVFEVTAQGKAADGSLALAGKLDMTGNGNSSGELTLENIEPARWVEILTRKNNLVPPMKLNGKIMLTAAKGFSSFSAGLDLTAASNTIAGFKLNEGEMLSIKGDLKSTDSDEGGMAGTSLECRINDTNGIALTNWQLGTTSYDVKGSLAVQFDLDRLGCVPGDIAAHVEANGPLTHEQGISALNMNAKLTGIKLFGVPIDAPFAIKGTLAYNNFLNTVSATDIDAIFREGTSLKVDKWESKPEEMGFDIPCVFETDFAPLVDLGLASAVSGTGKAMGTIQYRPEGVAAKFDFDADCKSLTVSPDYAVLEGMAVKGSIGNISGKTVVGSGEMQADTMRLGGGFFTEVRGPFSVDGGLIKTTGLSAKLFGGCMTADVDVNLLQPDLPSSLVAKLTNVDLAAITALIPIDAAKMTGFASGVLTLHMSGTMVQEFQLHLESKQNFAISVGLLENLLKAPFVQQFKNKNTLEKVMAEIVGKEGLRPFDSARLALNYKGDRVTGTLTLKSDKLDLTVDLAIDPAEVVNGITLFQQYQHQTQAAPGA